MDFPTFMTCAKALQPDVSVCVRGNHGIGKSQAVYQLGGHFNMTVIERRLSQMSEGDMIGLPELTDGVTRFAPPDWYRRACDEPVLLFLDELNRATPEIMQAAFQIVLDRELNGYKLHKDTRVYTAVNVEIDYNVNDMDPALLDRFWVVDLDPTAEDWLLWAKPKVCETIYDFILNNKKHLEHNGSHEAGRVYPSRRSWDRLSQVLRTAKVEDSPEEQLFYALSLGMVGPETAIAFKDHAASMDRNITGEDVINTWGKVHHKVRKMGHERLNAIIERVADHSVENNWSDKQGANASKFMSTIPDELKIVLWSAIADHKDAEGKPDKNLESIKAFHKHCKQMIVDAVNAKVSKDEEKKDEEEKA